MRLKPGTIALIIALAETKAPAEFRLFAPGVNKSSKGDFLFDAEAAKTIMSDCESRGRKRLPFDYEHKMYDEKSTPDEKIAAGWFSLEVRETGEGPELWATNIEWTPKAKQEIEAKERGYFSPTFAADPKTGRVLRLANIALTNTPALFGIPLLFEASDNWLDFTQEATPGAAGLEDTSTDKASMAKETSMKGLIALLSRYTKLSETAGEPEVMTVVTRLMDENTSLLTAVGAADVEAAKGRIQALKAVEVKLTETQQENVKLSAQIRDRDKTSLLKANEAKFTPAEIDGWVKSASLEMLSEYVKTAPDRVSLGNTGPDQPNVPNVNLSASDADICKRLGIDPAEYAKVGGAK